MSAQGRALVTLARQRGLIADERVEPALAWCARTGQGMDRALLAAQVQPHAVASLIRDLARGRFGCAACRAELPWEALAPLPDLRCPRCGGGLIAAGGALGTGLFTAPRADRTGSGPQHASAQATSSGPDRAPRPSRPAPDEVAFALASLGPPPGSDASWTSTGAPPDDAPSGDRVARPDERPSDRVPRVGRTIGGYAVERELGRGANGIVYLTAHPQTGQPLALKVLRDADMADEETIARFELEARIATKLRDPGIVAVHDMGRDGELCWFVMDYCQGPSLKERLSRGPLPPEDAMRLVSELARAMSVAHEQGVIHRDLKPANVILEGEPPRPRIADFGLARDRSLLRSMTRSGDVIGTPYYMAPEQLRGEKDMDARVDVYALGVLLYELVSGARPYDATSFAELVKRVETTDHEPLSRRVPGSPAALDAVISRALAKERGARYRGAAALRADLERVLEGARPRAAGGLVTAGGAGGGGGARVAIFAGALVLGLAAIGAAAWRAQRGPEVAPDRKVPVEPPKVAVVVGEADRREARHALEALAGADQPEERAAAEAALEAALARVQGDVALRRQVEDALRRLRVEDALARARAAARGAIAPGATDPALRHLDAALELALGDAGLLAEARLAAVTHHLRRGRYAEAAAGAEALEGVEGDLGREATLVRGRALEKLGRAPEARTVYGRRASTRDPGPGDWCARAALERLDGDLPGAALAAKSALNLSPRHAPSLLEGARADLDQGQAASAEARLEEARSATEEDPQVWVLQARLRLSESKLEAATLAVETALGLSLGVDPDALALRARIAATGKRWPDARADLDRALSTAAAAVEALVLRGWVREELKEPQAHDDWTQAWTVSEPACLAASKLLPMAAQHRLRKAVGAPPLPGATPAPSAAPTPPPRRPPPPTEQEEEAFVDAVTTMAGQLLGLGGSTSDTLALPPGRALEQAIERRVAAVGADARDELRRVLLGAARAQRWADLELPLRRAYDAARGSVAMNVELVRLLVARDRASAADHLVRVRALRDVPALVVDRLAAEHHWRRGRVKEALAAYDALAAADPAGVEGCHALAAAHLLRGAPAAARDAARQVVTRDATHAPSLILEAMARLQLGEGQAASTCITRALDAEGAADARLCALALVRDLAQRPATARSAYADQVGQDDVFDVTVDSACARLVAAEAWLASKQPADHSLASGALDAAARVDAAHPGVPLLRARLALVTSAPRAKVIEAWQKARQLAPDVPLPPQDLELFRSKHPGGADLDALTGS